MPEQQKHNERRGSSSRASPGASPDDTTILLDDAHDEPVDLREPGVGVSDEATAPTDLAHDAPRGLGSAADLFGPGAGGDDLGGTFETPDEVLAAGEALGDLDGDAVVAAAEGVKHELDALAASIDAATAREPADAPAPRAPLPEMEDPSQFLSPDDVEAELRDEAAARELDAGDESNVHAGDEASDDAEPLVEMPTFEQILEMSKRAGAVPAPAPIADAANEPPPTPALHDAAPPAAASPSPAEPAPAASASLGQLDEFLAGHADHAVSDEFETVTDVLAVADQAPAPAAPRTDEVPATPPPAAETETSPPATSPLPAAAAPAPAPQTPAAPEPAPRRRFHHAIEICGDNLYLACVVINRPLRRASETTRKTVGYAGLITVANAVLILLGKMILG